MSAAAKFLLAVLIVSIGIFVTTVSGCVLAAAGQYKIGVTIVVSQIAVVYAAATALELYRKDSEN